jgi:WD40 repeat protein
MNKYKNLLAMLGVILFAGEPYQRDYLARIDGADLANEQQPQTDLYGDTLPSGAVSRMGTVRFWLGRPISSIVFSPDGQTVTAVAAGYSATVPIWDANTGKLVRTLPGPRDALPDDFGIRQVAFAPEGERLAAACDDGTIRIWQLDTGNTIRTLRGHRGFVDSVSFAPDGRTLASSGEDTTLRLWNLSTGEELRQFSSPRHFGGGPKFTPDGSKLVSGWAARGNEGADLGFFIRVYDVATGKETLQFPKEGWFPSNYFGSDGRTIASMNGQRIIRFWSITTGKEVRQVPIENRDITGGCFSPDCSMLAAAGKEATLRLFYMSTGRQVRRIPIDPRNITHQFAFSPDGKTIAYASGEVILQLVDIKTGVNKIPRARHIGSIRSVCILPAGKMIVSAGVDNTVRLWDVASGKEVRRLLDSPPASWFARQGDYMALKLALLARSRSIGSLSFESDGKTVTAAGLDGTLTRWNTTSGEEFLRVPSGRVERIEKITISPDRKIIASAGEDGLVRIRDAVTGKEIRAHPLGHANRIRGLAFSPDGRKLASSSDDGMVRISESDTFRLLHSNRASTESIQDIAFSPDGRTVCMGGVDSILRLWHLSTGHLQQTPGQGDPEEHIIRTVAFSPNGARVAYSGDDAIVHVWDVSGWREIRRYEGHQAGINQIVYSQDSRLIVSCSDDGTIIVWLDER